MRNLRIWHVVNAVRVQVFIIEINEAELVRRRCMGEKIDPLPRPQSRFSRLVKTLWHVGTVRTKSWELPSLFHTAMLFKQRLLDGDDIPPDWTRKFKEPPKLKAKRKEKL